MHEIGIEWMTQTEVNGHFLELRGIPDEKLEWERIITIYKPFPVS